MLVICTAKNCSELYFRSHEILNICFLYRFSEIRNFGMQGWDSFRLQISSKYDWPDGYFDNCFPTNGVWCS
jgi:hypothetical protein